MNKADGENKSTEDKHSSRFIDTHSFRIVIDVVVVTTSLGLAVMYHKYTGHLDAWEVAGIAAVVILICLVVAGAAAWFFAKPRDLLNGLRHNIEVYRTEGEQLHFELRTVLKEALGSQPYVSEEALSIIEADANNIWVITTDLKNDVTPGKIRESVEANLKSRKHYMYFLPYPTNPNFPDAASNEHSFRASQLYMDHRDQIRFIHLPDDTLFLFREVVIYNPFPDPDGKKPTVLNGFTYFETGTGSHDQLVRIPNNYLQFLKGQLHRYAEDIGLRSEIERLIPELRDRLAREDFGYLGSLIGQSRIEDRQEFKNFLDSVRRRDADAANLLDKVLKRYLD